MSVPIQPLAEYLVAQPDVAESRTASGLFIPGNAQEKPKTAVVLAVGKSAKEVKVGDRILYKSYGPTEVKIGSEDFIVLKEEDVLATVKGK